MIKEASNGKNEPASLYDLTEKWKEAGEEPDRMISILKLLKEKGEIIECSCDRFKVV